MLRLIIDILSNMLLTLDWNLIFFCCSKSSIWLSPFARPLEYLIVLLSPWIKRLTCASRIPLSSCFCSTNWFSSLSFAFAFSISARASLFVSIIFIIWSFFKCILVSSISSFTVLTFRCFLIKDTIVSSYIAYAVSSIDFPSLPAVFIFMSCCINSLQISYFFFRTA